MGLMSVCFLFVVGLGCVSSCGFRGCLRANISGPINLREGAWVVWQSPTLTGIASGAL